jgi:hypothetical protein
MRMNYLSSAPNLKGGRNLEGVLSADCIAQKMDSKLMQTVMALQSAIRSVETEQSGDDWLLQGNPSGLSSHFNPL